MVIRGYRKMIYNCYNLLSSYYKFYSDGDIDKKDYYGLKEMILQNLIGFYSTVRQKKILIRKSRCVKEVKKFFETGAITQEEYEEQKKAILKR